MMGEYTGAAVIFGATGGVMEAALRTVADILEHEDMPSIEYKAVRGVDALIKEAELEIGGVKLRVAVAHSTAAARKLLDAIRDGSAPQYHFIEIMGCSGGCVCGGGQPQVQAQDLMDIDLRSMRAKALYEEDVLMPERKSHKNADVEALYKDFLGEPNGHLAHELLHTHYHKREIYPDSVLDQQK
jgi:NADH-quinone oxidoreductase subunit G/NADP-reducing hydrogenase subunit HndD